MLLFSMSEWPMLVMSITFELAPVAVSAMPSMCTKFILDVA